MCDCEAPKFIRHDHIKARKAHRCDECFREIKPHSFYHKFVGKWDDEIETFERCNWCQSVCELWEKHVYPECGPCFGGLSEFIEG